MAHEETLHTAYPVWDSISDPWSSRLLGRLARKQALARAVLTVGNGHIDLAGVMREGASGREPRGGSQNTRQNPQPAHRSPGQGHGAGYLPQASPLHTQSHHPDQSTASQSSWVTTLKKKKLSNDYSLAQISGAERAARHLHEGLGGSGALRYHSRLSF